MNRKTYESIQEFTPISAASRNYWTQKLNGEWIAGKIPAVNKQQGASGRDCRLFELPPELASAFIEKTQYSDHWLFIILTSGVHYLISRFIGKQDITIGIPVLAASDSINERLVLRSVVRETDLMKDYINEIKQAIAEANEYADCSIEYLRQVHNRPLYHVLVMLEPIHGLESIEKDNCELKFMFSHVADGRIVLKVDYDNVLYDGDYIDNLYRYLINYVKAFIHDPNVPISAVDLLDESDKRLLLSDFNINGESDSTSLNMDLVRTFEQTVNDFPDRIAIIDQHIQLTYKQLNERVNKLSRMIRQAGEDSIIGIHTERSVEMIVGILAVLKCGAAYLPLDPAYPQERLQQMINDSGIKLLLSVHPELVEGLNFAGRILFIGEELYGLFDSSNLNISIAPDDVAYVMYTSGSTGKPKGIRTTHKNILRVVSNTNYIQIRPDDVLLQLSSYAFDGSTFEIFGALLNGASLVIAEKTQLLDAAHIERLITNYQVSVVFFTTALFNAIVELNADVLSTVRKILVGGEQASVRHMQKMGASLPAGTLVNVYGPTECTVFATYYEVTPDVINMDNIPIGKPLSHTQLYILDSALNLLPLGAIGELCIGGAGLAQGYLNQPDLTAEKFVTSPFVPGERIYRTGDFARWLPDGNIEYIGRRDNMVKIRGHRIELEEIEKVLSSHDLVREAVVIVREDEPGNKYLCAYVTGDGEKSVSILREYMASVLPDYMVPAFIVVIQSLPLTPNGKVDRNRLPKPHSYAGRNQEYVAPRNEIEQLLASLWEDVLHIDNVGIHDNFFELGGDSIKALQVSARLHQLGQRLDMKHMLRQATIASVTEHIEPLTRQINQAAVEGEVSLTPIQSWFFEQQFTEAHYWNQAVMLYGKCGFDEAVLEQVLQEIVVHHDALRMTFVTDKTGSVRQYNSGSSISRPILEVVSVPVLDEEQTHVFIKEEAERIQRSLILEQGPLIRSALFRTDSGDHLLIVIHHLVVDSVSWRILLEDLAFGYGQAIQGNRVTLPAKTDSFQKWSAHLMSYVKSGAIQQEINYWESIDKLPVLTLPKDGVSKLRTQAHTGREQILLSKEETEQLLKYAHRAYNTQINDLLLTALVLTVRDWVGDGNVLVGLESHGRESLGEDIDISRTVGWFTSLYPVVISLSDSNDLGHHIRNVKETLRRTPHNGIGYGLIKYTGIKPLQLRPELVFNYLGQFDTDTSTEWFEPSPFSTGASVSPRSEQVNSLELVGMVAQGRMQFQITYLKDEFTEATMNRFAERFVNLLRDIAAHCISMKTTVRTPSDAGNSSLISLAEWDKLSNTFGSGRIVHFYPLSPMQEGMLFHSLKDRHSGMYITQLRVKLFGQLDTEVLESSFNRLIDRYDIFRTSFWHEGVRQPLQVVLDQRFIPVLSENLIELDQVSRERYIEQYCEEQVTRGFDLSNEPLMRVIVFQIGEQEYEMVWTHHHILMDGWCLGVVISEMLAIYSSEKNGTTMTLKPAQSYSRFIEWLGTRDVQTTRAYWKAYLDGYEHVTVLPGTQGKNTGYRRAEEVLTLDEDMTQRLMNLASKHQVTLNTLLLTTWGVLLQKYNDADDVVFGSVVSGRPSELDGIETMVGLFINTVPVRIRSSKVQTFAQLLQQVQRDQLTSSGHEYFPLHEIQSLTPLKGKLIQQIMVFENYPVEHGVQQSVQNLGLGFEVDKLTVQEQTNYHFYVSIQPGRSLNIFLRYNGEIYDAEDITRIGKHFCEVLHNIARNPDQLISEIGILTDGEKHQLLNVFNATEAPYTKEKTLHQMFEEQVERTPDRIAVVSETEQVTYRELNARANRLARKLRKRGVKADNRVGLLAERSVEMIVGIFGILKAGGAYVPIDPSYPQERMAYMLSDSGSQWLVGNRHLLDKVKFAGEKLELREVSLVGEEVGNLEAINDSRHLAYVIYTSGSTGLPKGVMVEHRSVINRLVWAQEQYPLQADDVILQKTSFGFDVSVWELMWWSLYGARVCLLPVGAEKDPAAIIETVRKHKVTIMHFVPSMLRLFVAYTDSQEKLALLSSLRKIFASGEALLPDQVNAFRHSLGEVNGTQLINMYGPTEATVEATYYECMENEDVLLVPIGRPISNVRLYIVNTDNQLQPVGAPGEICIGGDGVARG
uniref:non-ribosomal peptide synthetase n=1 Tax=Paenibacillus xylaniclasticus TaxID=588083 RepID=UPI0013DFAFD6